jgi:POT family proton-dependent oligopeptide transporter
MALFLFTVCLGSVLQFALVSVAVDPKIEWMYTGIAVATFICAPLFWFCHRHQDDTDIEDDAIVRRGEVEDAYQAHKPTIAEYEKDVKHEEA